MQELLAPNGKPSNLTPEQWKLVRTPEFKQWFGDWENLILTKINDSGIDEVSLKRLEDGVSKVVDENGEPKVMYHGSRGQFSIFSDENENKLSWTKGGKGFYFTSTFDNAYAYGENVFVCFIKAINPRMSDGKEHAYVSEYDLNKLKSYGSDSIYFDGEILNTQGKWVKVADELVVFEPNQIKLADGTNTTFDSNNNDIRFEDGGEIIINPTEIECHKCHWHWNVKDGGDDLFICHKCNYDNTKFYEFKGLEGEKILDTILYDKGGQILNLNQIRKGQYETKSNEIEIYLTNPKVLNGTGTNKWQLVILYGNDSVINEWFDTKNEALKKGAVLLNDFLDNNFKKGGRTIAQTPAPKKDQIKGSDKNKEGSSKDLKSAKEIELNDKTITSIKNKIDEHNEKHPNKKITLDSAKAVVRRGMGAYSSSYRPTISGGKPNSRVAWGLARLNAFLYKIVNGKSKSGKYSQDNDLIEELGYKVQKFSDGGQLENEELNKIKEAYDFGSEYFEGEIYGQEYKIRMNKNHPRNSSRNDDQSIHNLSLVNVEYPSAVVFRENRDKLQYQYDKIYNWDDAKEKIQDFFYEIKDRAEYYSDGGDIEAYEEAMGISYADGGEAKPKKVYVSIQLPYDIQKLNKKDYSTTPEYFYSYNEKPFEELKNGKLGGLVGVSTSPNNIAEWFIHRDCLIVMDYEGFIAINETETIDYYDSYQLMKNNLYLFRRLYANVSRRGEQEDAIIQTLKKILEKIVPEINLEMNLSQGQRYSELYRISRFLSPYETSAFPNWIEKNEIKIESPIDLTNAILDFNKLNDNWLGQGFENPVLTFDELLPIVEKGITNASKIYESEQEVVLKNRELNIPKKSQLFFIGKNELGNDTKSNKLELIEKYELKDLYKIHFVDRQELEKYRSIWRKKEKEKFKNQLEKGREELELKKEQVLDELLNYFLEKSISYVKNELEKEYLEYSESLDFYDETDENYIEQNLYSIPLVESIMNTYVLIVKNFWKGYIQKKRVEKLDLYAFNMFYFNVESELKRYFENNKDELDKLNNYRNTRGGFSLDLYRFERLLLKTINDYENLPELIGYKELAKMYLDKMGRELYRYYDKNDLKLVSQYKDGGEADEPTRFWGTEAGGVLIYCSSTDRYLILLRSEYVLEPNTWGIVSGKLDDNEDDVQQAVYREAEEEIGHKLTNLIPSYIFEKPNFKFHNFVSIVNEEFVPQLDWENSDYRWVKLDEMPENLHFGLKLLLQKEELPKLVKKNKMENEILIVEMNMYFNDTSVNFKNKEIPLKLNPPKNQNDFIDWSEENNIEFEQWGDFWNPESELIDTSYGYTFEIPLFKYIEYMKTEKFYTGGELKKGIKTEMEHKDTIKMKNGGLVETYLKMWGLSNEDIERIMSEQYEILSERESGGNYDYKEIAGEMRFADKQKYHSVKDLPEHEKLERELKSKGLSIYEGNWKMNNQDSDYYEKLPRIYTNNPEFSKWTVINHPVKNDETFRTKEEAEKYAGFKYNVFLDVLYEGSKSTRNSQYEDKYAKGGQTTEQKEKIAKVIGEFKRGKLKTSYGEKVTDRQQAIAIALSEAGISQKEDGGYIVDETISQNQVPTPFVGMALMLKGAEQFDSVYYIYQVSDDSVVIGLNEGNTTGISISDLKRKFRPATSEEIEKSKMMNESIFDVIFDEGGRVKSIHSKKGDIKLALGDEYYDSDTDVELVPVSELMKFREFDRRVTPKYNKENSVDNINHLKFMFEKEGIKSPLIIEYSAEDNSVLLIEGNHRLNSAIDMGLEYLPARVVLKKYGKYSPIKLEHSMKVQGVEADQFGYIPSNMKPSKVGIQGTKEIFKEGGIIEGKLHSECDDDGCGRKFQVGEGGHIIEAERDEAVIVAKTFEDNNEYTIKGTPSQISSALNVMGGGKNFDRGAEIIKSGQIIEIPALKTEAKNTDVDDIIDSGSIIINRRSMADQNKYEVTGTPKQIASAINSVNGNGVVIENGAKITKT